MGMYMHMKLLTELSTDFQSHRLKIKNSAVEHAGQCELSFLQK